MNKRTMTGARAKAWGQKGKSAKWQKGKRAKGQKPQTIIFPINVHKLQRIFKTLTEKKPSPTLVAILLILFFNLKFKVLGLWSLLLLADAERFDVRVDGWDTVKSSKIYQWLLNFS